MLCYILGIYKYGRTIFWKNGIKTLVYWLVIISITLVVLNHVVNNPDLQVSYSELVASINNNEVEKIEISPDKLTAQVFYIDAASDELPKNVAIPSIDSFMEQISEVMEKNPNFKVV